MLGLPGVSAEPLENNPLISNLWFNPLPRRYGIPGILSDSVEYGGFDLEWNVRNISRYAGSCQGLLTPSIVGLQIHSLHRLGKIQKHASLKGVGLRLTSFQYPLGFGTARQQFILHEGEPSPCLLLAPRTHLLDTCRTRGSRSPPPSRQRSLARAVARRNLGLRPRMVAEEPCPVERGPEGQLGRCHSQTRVQESPPEGCLWLL